MYRFGDSHRGSNPSRRHVPGTIMWRHGVYTTRVDHTAFAANSSGDIVMAKLDIVAPFAAWGHWLHSAVASGDEIIAVDMLPVTLFHSSELLPCINITLLIPFGGDTSDGSHLRLTPAFTAF